MSMTTAERRLVLAAATAAAAFLAFSALNELMLMSRCQIL